MAIIIFIILLSVLVFVHEAGHFIAAKASGMRVDEFGFGYPPRAKKLFRWKGTDFTLNWLPFGGFVKIFGENYEDTDATAAASQSFAHKHRGLQALVLVAGVLGNFVLAWFLFSLGLLVGMSSPVDLGVPPIDPRTTITQVLPDSPADAAGLKAGDEVLLVTRGTDQAQLDPESASTFISRSLEPVNITVKRGEEIFSSSVTPSTSIVPDRPAVGIALGVLGKVKLGFFQAISKGLYITSVLTLYTGKAFWAFVVGLFGAHPDLSSVSGPVGIVGMVGDAAALGFTYILSFAAIISINLAIINLFPFPALDGGRLLFVLIEALTRKRVPTRVYQTVNTVGFALLIILMVLITIRDVRHLI